MRNDAKVAASNGIMWQKISNNCGNFWTKQLRKCGLKAEGANKSALAGAPVGLRSWLIGWCHKTLLLSNQFRSQRSWKKRKKNEKKLLRTSGPKTWDLFAGRREETEREATLVQLNCCCCAVVALTFCCILLSATEGANARDELNWKLIVLSSEFKIYLYLILRSLIVA